MSLFADSHDDQNMIEVTQHHIDAAWDTTERRLDPVCLAITEAYRHHIAVRRVNNFVWLRDTRDGRGDWYECDVQSFAREGDTIDGLMQRRRQKPIPRVCFIHIAPS